MAAGAAVWPLLDQMNPSADVGRKHQLGQRLRRCAKPRFSAAANDPGECPLFDSDHRLVAHVGVLSEKG